MPEGLAGPDDGTLASGETPAAPSLDIETRMEQLKQEIASEYDKRIAGFQSALNQKDAALKAAQDKARELEMSGLSQEERDAREWTELQDQLAQAQRENALLKLSTEYPDLVPVYQKMLAAPDVKTQLDILAQVIKPAPPTPTATPELQPPAAPNVDPNNPANPVALPTAGAEMSPYGVPWTKELADRVLQSVGRLHG